MSANIDIPQTQLQPVAFEDRPWRRDPSDLEGVPKSRRRAIGNVYKAAVPAQIAPVQISLPASLTERLSYLLADLARFDALQSSRGYDLPALLLRSESSASSQIEHLTSSVRNVALAEVATSGVPHNARLIAGNVAAMRSALALPNDLTLEGILAVHRALMAPSGEDYGGALRGEQVWVGDTMYSPHGALFVPPHVERLATCMDDLVAFAARPDLNPIVKAAVFHAQFETVHPFIDGNGRTGRTLLHKILRREGVLSRATLPLSAGLLHNVDAYMESIRSYQRGDCEPLVECVANALDVALDLGSLVAEHIDAVLETWRFQMGERKGSSIHRLPDILVEQPVVDAKYLANRLSITPRAANSLIDRACEYQILRPIGSARRSVFYQADDLIDVLEQISSTPSIKRVLTSGYLL